MSNQHPSMHHASSPAEEHRPDLQSEAVTDRALTLAEAMDQAIAKTQAFREQVLAAAGDGTGVQPWDRDWPLGDFHLHEHLACEWNAEPALLTQLITIANWALRSPQGRQALLQDGQVNNPWQHTLDTVREFRDGLTVRQRQLLELRENEEQWMHQWPLGQFDLFEHMVTNKDFRPDWFTTGELIEMAEWALNAPDADAALRDKQGLGLAEQAAVLQVLETFLDALQVRRQRLVLAQAQQTLGSHSPLLEQLEQRFCQA